MTDVAPLSPDSFHSYHCICSQLLFTSTTPIEKLPRRKGQGLDQAYILHLPALPAQDDPDEEDEQVVQSAENVSNSNNNSSTKNSHSDAATQSGTRSWGTSTQQEGDDQKPSPVDNPQNPPPGHFAFSLTYSEGLPQIIIRPDGFEKRYWARCQRCNIIVGYYLDWMQFHTASLSSSSALSGLQSQDGEEKADIPTGPRARILYIIPGGLSLTDDMLDGKQTGKETWEIVNDTAVPIQPK